MELNGIPKVTKAGCIKHQVRHGFFVRRKPGLLNTEFFDFAHRPIFYGTQRFGSSICFRPQVKA